MNILYWGGYRGREGWWVGAGLGTRPVAMIHGPSICRSSGGGPDRAFEAAEQQVPDLMPLRVNAPPRHSYFPTRAICQYCTEEAEALNARQQICD